MMDKRQFEDDDLALYAMGLLAEPEASAVARHLSESAEDREQVADVRAQLAAYAQVAVAMQEPPEGSFDRFMARIAQERQPIRPVPMSSITSWTPDSDHLEDRGSRSARGTVLPWVGWALAAGLALTAGKFYRDRSAVVPPAPPVARTESAPSAPPYTAADRVALQRSAEEQTQQIHRLQTELAKARTDYRNLRSSAGEQATRLDKQTARIGEAAAQQTATEQERNELQQRLSTEQAQLARLTADEARARQVLDTLSDPTALRVTLTEPKSQPVPSGRATYVAARGTLVFQAGNLASLRPNKVYELWLLPADNSNPVPLGTFSPDARGSASLVFPQLPSSVPAKGFAITIENTGGSQTPTMPLILAGTGS